MDAPFELKGIDHIVLRTLRLDDMLAFYQDVLGANLERHLPELGLYQLRAGTSLIDVIDINLPLGSRAGGVAGTPNMDHVCLAIQPWDEDGLREYLLQRGVKSAPAERRYGADGFGPSIYISDPDGNMVELKASKA